VRFAWHTDEKEVSVMKRSEDGTIELHLKGLSGQSAEVRIDKFGMVEFVAIKNYPFSSGDLHSIEFLASQQKAAYLMEISGEIK
jgi:hypothetical protein